MVSLVKVLSREESKEMIIGKKESRVSLESQGYTEAGLRGRKRKWYPDLSQREEG